MKTKKVAVHSSELDKVSEDEWWSTEGIPIYNEIGSGLACHGGGGEGGKGEWSEIRSPQL